MSNNSKIQTINPVTGKIISSYDITPIDQSNLLPCRNQTHTHPGLFIITYRLHIRSGWLDPLSLSGHSLQVLDYAKTSCNSSY
jgi:hypothetical protein